MFGLGWVELLIIGGVISLIAGPAMLKRLVGSARALDQTRRDLTGPGALERLLGEGDEARAKGEDPDEEQRP